MEFDYVIVGGGSAGSTLAARLSEDTDATVCLLEAGGDGKHILIRAPTGTALMLPGRPKISNWAYQTVPQPGLGGRRGYQPRGKALGGSSAINAMLYIRGHRSDYDGWTAAGCDGWGWQDVLPYFRKAEGNQRGEDAFHGASGPLQVGEQRTPRPIVQAFVDACGENQIRFNDDFNGPEQEGAGYYQVTQFWSGPKMGERCSAAAAYLHPAMDRRNLSVLTDAHATGIVLENKRATGVRFRRGGREEIVSARREVILCGGAFNSPQLLLLSGIGPGAELARHGILVKHELAGVGQNLQDHLDFVASWKSGDRNLLGVSFGGLVDIIREARRWKRDGTGLIASPGAEGAAFIRSDPALEKPDLQLHFVVGIIDDHARKLHLGHGYSCHVCVPRPHSRGTVGLDSANPLAPPRIDPNFLADERDTETLLKGIRIMRRILAAPALAPYRKTELYLGGTEPDDTELIRHIRARSDTIYHPVGTCRMGTDENAVVDTRLRVRGLEQLRVVDASVMPTLIGGNTNAPTIMIAEKAADLIRAA
ncbi:GMC family oxidoreductase [Mesorhizobium australicum]|uniref:Choline dehydrogenase n=1 Tax=Mesorhizobium australicum TaxID=536018 RepID=A0A1X7MVN1_9HYPH|nr:GMC family oxidoreductase N-terminal domain-containing protein [Mesorhizobium australicum]SMH28867.1 Choline dehydrogenase [Mesorhizobium australicum]